MKVWILVALINSGHVIHSVVPTLEFSTKEKCEAAISTISKEFDSVFIKNSHRCVMIEK